MELHRNNVLDQKQSTMRVCIVSMGWVAVLMLLIAWQWVPLARGDDPLVSALHSIHRSWHTHTYTAVASNCVCVCVCACMCVLYLQGNSSSTQPSDTTAEAPETTTTQPVLHDVEDNLARLLASVALGASAIGVFLLIWTCWRLGQITRQIKRSPVRSTFMRAREPMLTRQFGCICV